MAVRDSDYAAFTWWPRLPELDEWLALYEKVARGNGGEPDAGRRLLSWAHAAGFTDVTATVEHLVLRRPSRTATGGAACGPSGSSSPTWRGRRCATGAATEDDLRRISDGWRAWAADPDGWLSAGMRRSAAS